jgi:branched-chain amino acid transport system ATP-binding protein
LPALVELLGVSKSFGSLRAIEDVSLTVDEGEALGIVGPNGAGKTTLLNVIAGSLRADRGRVMFAGSDITTLSGHEHCRAGIARTFQIPRPFAGLTAFENVLVGATYGRGGSDGKGQQASVEALEQARLLGKANTLAGQLTLLERKRLELARALVTEPRILLLDEIGGGLTELEVLELVETINALRGRGITIVWIEHIVHALLSVVDRLVALAAGRKLIEGDPQTVIQSPELQDVYLGSTVGEPVVPPRAPSFPEAHSPSSPGLPGEAALGPQPAPHRQIDPPGDDHDAERT